MSLSCGRLLLCVGLVFALAGAARSDGIAGVANGGIASYPPINLGLYYPGVMPIGPGVMPSYPSVPAPAPAPPSVRSVVCTADGSLLACWGPDNKTIQLWSVATGKELCQLKGHQEGVSLVFADDGKTLASAGRETIRFWDVATRKESRRINLKDRAKKKPLAFAPDGKVLAVACAGTPVALWEVTTGNRLQQLPGHAGSVNALAFSPDGTLLASGGDDGTIRLWDTSTGKERRLGERLGKITALAFAPDGRTLASASEDHLLRFWDLTAGKELRRLQGGNARMDVLAFSPDGKTVASTRIGYPAGYPQAGYGNLGGQFGFQGVGQFGFQGVGQFGNLGAQFGFMGVGPGMGYQPPPPPPPSSQVVLWEVATGKERGHLIDGGKSVVFGADGKTVILGIKDNKILVQNLAGAKIALRTKTWAQPTDPDAMWTDLIGEDAGKAYVAVWALAAAPDRALPLLRERLRPARPPVDPRLIDRWIADLESDRFDSRHRATLELENVGRQAEKALREALKTKPSLEMTRRVDRLLARLQEKSLAPEAARTSRAIEVLEHMDAPEALQLLEALTNGLPGAALTIDARAALNRVAQRP